MSKEHVRDLIEQLGEEIELPGLTLDENGYCCLLFDNLAVNVEVDENGSLFMYANVGEIPASGRERFYRTLLSANYFYRGTGGATLGIDAEQNVVLLILQTPGGVLDYGTFKQIAENFINIAHTWTERIEKFSPGAAKETETPLNLRPHPGMFA